MIKKDGDGHKYKIPKKLESRFDELLNATFEVKYGSKEFRDACEAFSNEFLEYMVS